VDFRRLLSIVIAIPMSVICNFGALDSDIDELYRSYFGPH